MEGYSMFRGLSLNTESLKKFSTYLTATLTESFLVIEDSWVNEKTLGDIDIIGATVIAVIRNNKSHPNPEVEFIVLPGDMLILFGSHMQLNKSIQYLREGPGSQL